MLSVGLSKFITREMKVFMCAIGQRIKNMILTKFAIVNVTNIDGLHASGADRLQSQIRVFV